MNSERIGDEAGRAQDLTADTPQGWMLVPIAPTAAMINAGADAAQEGLPWKEEAQYIWAAMLSMTPEIARLQQQEME